MNLNAELVRVLCDCGYSFLATNTGTGVIVCCCPVCLRLGRWPLFDDDMPDEFRFLLER